MAYLTKKVDAKTIYKQESGSVDSDLKERQLVVAFAGNFLGLTHKEIGMPSGMRLKVRVYSDTKTRYTDLNTLRGSRTPWRSTDRCKHQDKEMLQRKVSLCQFLHCINKAHHGSAKQNFMPGGWTGW
jgi:hypothetical protein